MQIEAVHQDRLAVHCNGQPPVHLFTKMDNLSRLLLERSLLPGSLLADAGMPAAAAFPTGARIREHPPEVSKQLRLQGQVLLLLSTENAGLLLCYLLCTDSTGAGPTSIMMAER